MCPLFVPGPVDIHPDVLNALSRPMIYHRGVEFEALYHQIEQKARSLFSTNRHTFISSFSGTGAMELAMRNFLHKDVLICVGGGFSNRWYEIAMDNGKSPDLLKVEEGRPILPEDILPYLQKKSYEGLAIVHNETSTGVENPIKEIAETVAQQAPNTLIFLDCVSSIGGTEILFDDWGIDYAFGSINKCLAVPPGLAISVASERAIEKAKTVENRGWFMDVVRMENQHFINTVPSTPAVSLFYALEVQLNRIVQEGLQNRFDRHRAMAERIAKWGESHQMPPIAPKGYRSSTMTTVMNGHHLDFNNLRTFLHTQNMEIANGYDDLKDKTFRIANMGELQMSDVEQLLSCLEEYIEYTKNG
jgi:aspartate aminotransferase-like enzyme